MSATSSIAKKQPVTTAFSRMFKIATPAESSITTAPATFGSNVHTTPRYCAVPSAITAGMNTMDAMKSANVTMLTGPASGFDLPLNACQTSA